MNWPTGQAAFVTGAASGIGLGISRALVAAGAKVVLADIDAARVAAVAKELADAGGAVVGLKLDVGDPDQWQEAANRAEEMLGPISILCNNAGANGGGEIDQTKLMVWRWVYKVNIESQFIGVSTFLPRFKARGGRCHIINTASMAGLVPMARVAAYSSAKFASVGFTMVLRDELKGSEIGVSLLCPGTVASRMALTSAMGEAALLGREIDRRVVEGNSAMTAKGADPDLIGKQVLEAMQQGQFLIITHRDWQPLVTAVQSEVQRAFNEFNDRHGPDPAVHFWAQGVNPIST